MRNPYPDPRHPFPKPLLAGAIALAVGTIAITALARSTEIGTERISDPRMVETRTLRFSDGQDHSLLVTDAASGRLIGSVAPEAGGFMRAMLRGLGRNRLQHTQPEDAPFRLARAENGDLWLDDMATGQRIDLRAFGPTNAGAFAAFLGGQDKRP